MPNLYPVVSLFCVTSSSTQFPIVLCTEMYFTWFFLTANTAYLNSFLKDILDKQWKPPFNFPLKSLCLYTVTLEDGPAWLRKAFEEAFVWCKGWHKEWGGKSEPNSLFSFLSIPAPPWWSLLPDDLSGFIYRAVSHPSLQMCSCLGLGLEEEGRV